MLTTQQYVFDTLGNFRTVKLRNGQTEFYQHDGQYRLVSLFLGSTLQYRRLYAEKDRIVAKVNNSGYLSEGYVHGIRGQTPEYIHKNSQKYRVITDHLGSMRLVVNTADGTIGQRMDYNEWGDVLNDTSPGFQPYGFAGGIYLPSARVVKFGARIYDPSSGRWLSKDPIRFKGGDSNLFGYVAQDPVNFVDPMGLWSLTASFFSGGAGGSITVGADNNTGRPFVTIRSGVGVGSGASYDPDASPPPGRCPGKINASFGVYAEASISNGAHEIGGAVNGGVTSAPGSGYYGDVGPSAPTGTSSSVGGSISAGVELSFF